MRFDAEVSKGRQLGWTLGATGLSVVLLAFVAIAHEVSTLTMGATALLVAALSFIALTRGAPHPRGTMRRVSVDSRGLSVDGVLAVPKQSIQHATVKEESDGTCAVVIETRGMFVPPQVVRVKSARMAQSLADTVEQVGRASDVSTFDALPPWAHRIRWLTVLLTASPWIVFNVLRYLPGFMLFVIVGLYGVIALPLVIPQKIAIGEDGVLMRWAGRRRFLAFGRIGAVQLTPLGVELFLLEGRTLEIRVTQRADAELPRRRAILQKIEEGIEAHRALVPAEDEALLKRGERNRDEWMQEMQRLGAADSLGYRAMSIPRERLWSVVENPSADPSAREGAALALRTRLDDEDRRRLTAIAQKSASPRLRVAMDAVASTTIDDPKLRITLEQAELQDPDHLHPRSRDQDDELVTKSSAAR
jgi:hypothetical protein